MSEFKPFFVPRAQYAAQLAAAEKWVFDQIEKLEAEGYVKEHPAVLCWTKRDAQGAIIAEVLL